MEIRKNISRPDFKNKFNDDNLETRLISLRPVSKTRAGGRIRSFAVLFVCGNKNGLVGYGTGKATDVSDAIRKAENRAKKNLKQVSLFQKTIASNVEHYHCGIKFVVKKAVKGTGLKAGGVARDVLTLAGIEDISCKCIGNSMSNHNVVYGLIEALTKTKKVANIAKRLGLPMEKILQRGK